MAKLRNYGEFFMLVAEMRRQQKEYFRTRTKEALEKSKSLEREVDAEIKTMDDIFKSQTQQSLFDCI